MNTLESDVSHEIGKQEVPLHLPTAFVEFLGENGLDPTIYSMADTIPRYIRLKPGFDLELDKIASELNCKVEKVEWLQAFYSIPPQIQIAGSKAYQLGKIYGMDAASGAAVFALGVSLGDHILDLCAAPGAKLCMLSDMLGSTGSLTGVDVARHRLAACRTMLQKYSLGDRCRLFVADGTSFSILPPKACGELCVKNHENYKGIFLEWSSKKRPWKERKKATNAKAHEAPYEPELIYYGKHSGVVGMCRNELFRPLDDEGPCVSGYDKVLVDAECTHDGSIKHIKKFEFWGWDTLDRRVLDAGRTNNLFDLQLGLLTNGFKLLKVGGSLVYSTCSLTVAQNENVVEQFLASHPLAELREVEAANGWPCRKGKIPKTLRFAPATSQTSGLFIAKISKLPSPHI